MYLFRGLATRVEAKDERLLGTGGRKKVVGSVKAGVGIRTHRWNGIEQKALVIHVATDAGDAVISNHIKEAICRLDDAVDGSSLDKVFAYEVYAVGRVSGDNDVDAIFGLEAEINI